MTLHTAKGLEYPIVFLTGMEQGTFPHSRAMENMDELSEERRLAYVGITRAKRRLYLTRAAVRAQWGRQSEMMPSQFLDEIPDSLIDWKRREAGMERMRSGWRNDGFDDGFSDEFGGWDDGDSDYGAGSYGRSSYGALGPLPHFLGVGFRFPRLRFLGYGVECRCRHRVGERRDVQIEFGPDCIWFGIVFLGPLARLRILYGCIWSPPVAWRFLIIPFLGFPFGCRAYQAHHCKDTSITGNAHFADCRRQ